MLVFSFASETAQDTGHSFAQELNGIPIYFDFVASDSSSAGQDPVAASDPSRIFSGAEASENNEPEILESIQLLDSERQLLYTQEPFNQTLERAQEIIADGGIVRGVHFLLPASANGNDLSPATVLANGDWRDYTLALRTYNGFEFRYLDSFIDGETGFINVEDIGTVAWREVASSGLKALIPTAVSNLGVPAVGTALSVIITLSDVIPPLNVRPNVTYSYGAESYIKYNALFRHYMRSFYISDESDLISGFDYYIAGTAEEAEIENYVMARWPTNTNWRAYSGKVGARYTIKTPGFDGANSFLSTLIQHYSLQRKCYENIQLEQVLIDVMLNTN